MKSKELYYKIKNAEKARSYGGSVDNGLISWNVYRNTFGIWHRVPTQAEWLRYKAFCTANDCGAESLEYIASYMQKKPAYKASHRANYTK